MPVFDNTKGKRELVHKSHSTQAAADAFSKKNKRSSKGAAKPTDDKKPSKSEKVAEPEKDSEA